MRSARPQADGDEEEPSVATKRTKHTAGESSSEQAGSASARALGQGWHFLKAPTAKDVRGNRRCRKALDAPLRPFEYLVKQVLDFEWTCDNKKKLHPLEIIEFPSVLIRTSFPPKIVSEFQVYCKPRVNPRLTDFCKELTAITQEMVDSGVFLEDAIRMHRVWLERHGVLRESEASSASFTFVTWTDADIMFALESELSRLNLQRPSYFNNWINLKLLYKSHFKKEAVGGLQVCVERLGIAFEGRAHSGLVDSRNTAAIVMKMLQEGFQFRRNTRGFGPNGLVWGKNSRSGAENERNDGSQAMRSFKPD